MPAYAAEMETEVEESVAEEITTELLEESTVETVASEEFTTEETPESTTEEECVEEVTSEVVEEVSVVETTESESVEETVVETIAEEVDSNIVGQEINSGYTGSDVVNYALQFEGYPYVLGTCGPSSFDCVGLVKYVYSHFGVELPMGTYSYNGDLCLRYGTRIGNKYEMQEGDIVFYGSSYNELSHAAIYVGNGKAINALNPDKGVQVNAVDYDMWVAYGKKGTYYTGTFQFGLRILGTTEPASFPLQDGQYYYIKNRNAGLVLDVENTAETAKVVLFDKLAGNTNQMWRAVKHADGYSFINCTTGYAMDVYGYSTENLTEIKQYVYHGDTNQRFKLIDRGGGYYSIHPICSGLGLDAYEAGTGPGTKIVQYGYHGGNNMQWSFEPVYNDPIGNLDYMTGMTGQVYMNGWALDNDLPTTPLDIHVYIGSGDERKCYAVFNANIYREDVANAYPGVGANHGFEYTISMDLSGYQNVDVFAINIGGGTNNTCIGSGTVYIEPDTTKPVVTNAYISQYDANGYTVVATASDNIGVQKVEFATWRNGSAVIWYPGTLNPDGTYSCRINTSDFGNVEGTYYTDVYAWDYAGNASVPKSFTQYIDKTAPVITEKKAERIADNLVKISCKASDNTGVISMYFPTWTDYNGQDDLKSDWETYYKGKKEGDWWVFYVYDYDHNFEKGNYTTHIYPYDAYNNHCSGGVGYSFSNSYQPQIFTCGDHTYELYNDLLTWDEAKAKCESLGGHLVTINSQEEQNAVVAAMSTGVRENYFIGGKTVNGETTWITGEPLEYSNWYPGEPNNYGGVQGFYEINKASGLWDDIGSTQPGIGFICEYEPDAVIPDDIPDETIPEGLWIAGIDENGYTYTGKAIKPEVRVYDHDTRLQAGKDYTIAYKNNKKANDASDAKTAPTIIVKGKGNYSSQETATFKILPKSISDTDITVDSIVLKYNKKIQKPIPVVKRDGKKLKNKTDFTVQYVELAEGNIGANKNPGTYTIRITGKGGYTGSRDVTFTITENKLMSKMTVSKIPDQRYTGSAITPAVTVKNGKTTLTDGTDYTVSYQNNTEVGTATILITGKGSYSGEKKVAFKIKGISLSKATVTGIPKSVTYTGSAITSEDSAWGNKPVLNIAVDGENKTLTEGTDYTISYQKNVNAGTASIIFKGINGYTGTLKKNFKITAYDITVDPLGNVSSTVDASVVYEKGGSRPKPVVRFGNSVLAEGKDYMLTYANNTRVNDGSDPGRIPYVTIKGKGNYKGTRSLAFKITMRSMEGLTISAPDKVYKNQKNAYKTTPKITDLNGKVLKAGTDYEKAYLYTYKNEVMLADGTVRSAGSEVGSNDIVPAGTVLIIRVQGKANYSDDYLQGEYRIVKSNISKAKVKVESQIYTGSQIEPGKEDIIIKIGKTTLSSLDYEIIGYSNNIKKGNAKLTIKGVGNYGGTKTVTFKIKSKGFLWWWR